MPILSIKQELPFTEIPLSITTRVTLHWNPTIHHNKSYPSLKSHFPSQQELPFTDIQKIPSPSSARKKPKLWAYMVISRWKCSPVCFLSVYLPDYSFLGPGIGALLPTRSRMVSIYGESSVKSNHRATLIMTLSDSSSVCCLVPLSKTF